MHRGCNDVSNIYTCCFFGHREINETEELKKQISAVIERLIVDEKVDTFLFGSKSRYNDLCYELVTEIKEKQTHIKRVYVRAEFPNIDDNYKAYLLESYEDTYYPKDVIGSGKACYIKRNFEMIKSSRFCVVYCESDYNPKGRKSGTKIALDYALKHRKEAFCFPIPIKTEDGVVGNLLV